MIILVFIALIFFLRILNDYLTKGPGYIASSEEQYREFQTPDKSLYRDINTSTVLPNVINTVITVPKPNYIDWVMPSLA